jgi:hypothetical protein
MTENLRAEIQNLYETFSGYTLNKGMEACPCCVTEAHKEVLYSKPLKQLSAGELSLYYMKAMTTWGEVDDFKHFLPRFFELMATNESSLEVFILFDKLEYGNWSTWGLSEREAIKSFLVACWVDSTISDFHFLGNELLYFGKALGSFQPLLDNWKISIPNWTFRNFVHFIFDNYQSNKIGKHIDEKDYHILGKWLAGRSAIIEQGFYYYEKTDPDFAQKISYCYDIVLRIA